MFQRQFALCALENFCKNLCSATKIILSSQHVAKKSNHTEFVRLVVATKFCCYTRNGCRWDVSLPLADLPVHSDWSVAATYSLVSSDLKHSLNRLFSPVTARYGESVTGNPFICCFFFRRWGILKSKINILPVSLSPPLLSLWHCATDPPFFTITLPLFHHPSLSLFHCFTACHYHCSTVLPPVTITVPLFHCSTTVYYHCSTVPPPFTITVPLFHHLSLTLFHCFTTCHYYCSTVPPPFTITVPLFLHLSPSLFHYSTTLHSHCSTVPPPVTNTVPLFHHPSPSLFHCSITCH